MGGCWAMIVLDLKFSSTALFAVYVQIFLAFNVHHCPLPIWKFHSALVLSSIIVLAVSSPSSGSLHRVTQHTCHRDSFCTLAACRSQVLNVSSYLLDAMLQWLENAWLLAVRIRRWMQTPTTDCLVMPPEAHIRQLVLVSTSWPGKVDNAAKPYLAVSKILAGPVPIWYYCTVV